jgi:hypothetical protein
LLTLSARKEKKQLWLSRGFKRISRRKNFLLNYWDCRLKQGNPADLKLFFSAQAQYQRILKKAQDAAAQAKSTAYPSAVSMVKSAASAAAGWAKSGFKGADEQTIETRKKICASCEFWDSAALKGTGRCTKCGCSTWAKIRMSSSSCPEKKW